MYHHSSFSGSDTVLEKPAQIVSKVGTPGSVIVTLSPDPNWSHQISRSKTPVLDNQEKAKKDDPDAHVPHLR